MLFQKPWVAHLHKKKIFGENCLTLAMLLSICCFPSYQSISKKVITADQEIQGHMILGANCTEISHMSLLPLNIHITNLKSKLLSSIAWINPNLSILYKISNPQTFNMDYNFYRTLSADVYSKHILIILVICSLNLRKLQKWLSEFEWD